MDDDKSRLGGDAGALFLSTPELEPERRPPVVLLDAAL